MFGNLKIKIIDDSKTKEAFYCTVCLYPLVTNNDFKYNEKFNCCYECYMEFAESRKDKWLSGWRPKQSVVDNYINKRKQIYEKTGE